MSAIFENVNGAFPVERWAGGVLHRFTAVAKCQDRVRLEATLHAFGNHLGNRGRALQNPCQSNQTPRYPPADL